MGPCLECAQLIYEELKKILYYLEVSELRRFENLSSELNTVLENLFTELMTPTNQLIKNYIEIEMGHINTLHPDFIMGAKEYIANDKQPEDMESEFEPQMNETNENGFHSSSERSSKIEKDSSNNGNYSTTVFILLIKEIIK